MKELILHFHKRVSFNQFEFDFGNNAKRAVRSMQHMKNFRVFFGRTDKNISCPCDNLILQASVMKSPKFIGHGFNRTPGNGSATGDRFQFRNKMRNETIVQSFYHKVAKSDSRFYSA